MTGVGFAAGDCELGAMRIEARSVNGRGLSVKLRLPTVCGGLEAAIEERVRMRIARGSVQVVIERSTSGATLPDRATLRAVAAELRSLAAELQLPPPGLADVVQAAMAAGRGEAATSRPLPPDLQRLLDTALDELVAHRTNDGIGTVRAMREQLDAFAALRARAAARAPQLADDYRDRLLQRVTELVATHVDPAPPAIDLVREVAVFADRVDVREELQRLAAHLDELHAALDQGGEVGRRVEFLLQELLRETNTLGSKSPDTAVAHAVVAMKSCIDRLREQAANLE